MRRVIQSEPAEGNAREWHTKAQQTLRALVSGYKPGDSVQIEEALYKAAKPFLLALWNQKCAYCESLITNSQPGDVEHYRPKGRIRDENGKIVRVSLADVEADHPGYWWLAYAWRNLLPSCTDCNRRRGHDDAGSLAGKSDHFAIRGKRAVLPTDDLDQEDALLLDPSREDFDASQHFEFLEDGKIKPKTPQASYTCELLGLNEPREWLVGERRRAVANAKRAMADVMTKAMFASDEELRQARDDVNDMWLGRTPHTSFAIVGLEIMRQQLKRAGTELRLPLP